MNTIAASEWFLDRLAAAWPPSEWRDVPVLIAVSGGADSVAILRGLTALSSSFAPRKDVLSRSERRLTGPLPPPAGATRGASGPLSGCLIVAHFNHRTRGQESDEDERFVRELAERLGMRCIVGMANERQDASRRYFDIGSPAASAVPLTSENTGDGFEAAARAARYEFLTSAARETGARYVVTAHTADDQAETVLHRILRGTGIAGLSGIPRTRLLAPGITLIRPLLAFRRDELRAHLQEIGQGWREDASNAVLDRTRNRLRGELIPHLTQEYNPRVVEAVLRLSDLAREGQEVIQHDASKLVEECVQDRTPDQVVLNTTSLRGQPIFLVCEVLAALWRQQDWPRQAMGWDEWRQLASLATADGEAFRQTLTLPGAVGARREGTVLTLTRS